MILILCFVLCYIPTKYDCLIENESPTIEKWKII